MLRFSRASGQPSPIVLADRAREARQWDVAVRHYRTALARNPHNPPIWVQYGHALKEGGSYSAAEAAYRRAIADDPTVADTHLQLGHLLKLQGRTEEAKAAYLRALAIDQSPHAAAVELAALGCPAEDLPQLMREIPAPAGEANGLAARSRHKRWRESIITRADRARDLGQWDIAAQLYRRALDRNPRNPPIWVQYGHVLKQSGQLPDAEQAYRRALTYDGRLTDAHLEVGRLLKLRGAIEAAQHAFLQAFALDPSLPDTLSELNGLGWSAQQRVELTGIASPDLPVPVQVQVQGLTPEESQSPARQAPSSGYEVGFVHYRIDTNGGVGERASVPSPTPPAGLSVLRGLEPRGRIAVVLHLFYPELWEEMREAIARISEPFDLFVTLVKGSSDHVGPLITESFENARIINFENRGRDIGPFMALVRSGVLFKYELICKVHAKRSTHREDGDAWRRALIDGVLGSPTRIQQIVARFRADADLGIVLADGNIYDGPDRWAGTEQKLAVLLPRIGISPEVEHRRFPGGSIFWIRPFLLRTLASLDVAAEDFEPEPAPIDGTLCHAIERLFGLICEDAGMRFSEYGQLNREAPAPEAEDAELKVIAYYLPQFHPIPENDAWWGTGFTEWTNVTRARPLFQNHRQPRLPTELGFYDLRLPETREAQVELARRYGVSAFCYYYYWFNGRRVLDRPLNEVLASGAPAFPFLICWANEPWSWNWDGLNDDVLLPQIYEPGWPARFAADVAPLMKDRRYVRFGGKPMLLIYRIGHVPNCKMAMRELRGGLAAAGVVEVHLAAAVVKFPGDTELPQNPSDLGLDAYFDFPPHQTSRRPPDPLPRGLPERLGGVYDYIHVVSASLGAMNAAVEGVRHRGVMAGWDNTPRMGEYANIFHGATPANFRRWLRGTIAHERRQGGERVVFINAWNEWAEGTYLEPDRDFGRGWLEAVASAIGSSATDETSVTVASPGSDVGREAEQRKPRSPGRRRLQVHRPGALGDVVLITPVLKALRQKFPEDEIIVSTDYTEILQGNPHLDGVVKSSTPLPGFNQTLILDYEAEPEVHIVDAYARIAQVSVSDYTPEIYLDDDERIAANDLLRKAGVDLALPFCIMQIESGWRVRDWPVDRFKQVTEALERDGVQVVVLGLQPNPPIDFGVDLRGRTTVRSAAAVIEKCTLAVTVDSSLMHIAYAFRRPVVSLFGCTDPELRIPKWALSSTLYSDVECRGCHHRQRPLPVITAPNCPWDTLRCMESLSSGLVIDKARAEIARAERPLVSIVIPHYTNYRLVDVCLTSIYRCGARVSFEVIAVLDASPDDSFERLQAWLPQVRIVSLPTNRGFSGTCNAGAEAARGKYLLFLNNDTKITPGWLDELVGSMEADSRIGIAGPKLLYPDSDNIQHCGTVFNELGLGEHIYRLLPKDFSAANRPRYYRALTGACVLIERDFFRMLGGFDTTFHGSGGCEDTDLCFRVLEHGKVPGYCPASVVYHYEGVTRGLRGPEHPEEIFNRNLLQQRWSKYLVSDIRDYRILDKIEAAEGNTWRWLPDVPPQIVARYEPPNLGAIAG